MDFSFFKDNRESSFKLIMDNDSGYISQNIDQESSSDHYLDSSSTSTVEILKSFLPQPVYLSEDALLERPEATDAYNRDNEVLSASTSVIEASFGTEEATFSGFDTEVSDISIIVPPIGSVYIDLDSYETESNSLYLNTNTTQGTNSESGYSYIRRRLEKQEKEFLVENGEGKFAILSNKKQEVTTSTSIEKRTDNVESEVPNKENVPNTKNITTIEAKLKTPIKTKQLTVDANFSPDLFADEDADRLKIGESPKLVYSEKYLKKEDKKLLAKVKRALSGCAPPSSVTVMDISAAEMLEKIKENKDYFWGDTKVENDESLSKKSSSSGDCGSLLVNGSYADVVVQKEWPEIMWSRFHGLHHNRSKTSEEFEHLCVTYGSRYVGAETQSSCTIFGTKIPTPLKKKTKQNWETKSPGRRLSHLARRRITFSNPYLHTSSLASGSRARQILVDVKRLENKKKSPRKSPRKTPRKTPNKSPTKGRTPSSSAKKKLRMRFRLLSDDFKDTVPLKRALFQPVSDSDKSSCSYMSNFYSQSSCSNSLSNSFSADFNKFPMKKPLVVSPVKLGTRRTLFPSPKKSPFKIAIDKKRKYSDLEEPSTSQPFFCRSTSEMFLSQRKPVLSRSKSDVLSSSQLVDLSAAHKKKLQWAVFEALKMQNITPTHPQFKTFASILARVTRRFILSTNASKGEGGTSERMFRIARHHSYQVVKGKTVDEIIDEYMKSKSKISKPQGYVGLESSKSENELKLQGNKENISQDKYNLNENSGKKNFSSAGKFKTAVESRIDRIRKVINFDNNR